MRLRIGGALLVLTALMIPGALSAQTMVTLEVPVNLTKLSPEVTKVQANCTLSSNGLVATTGLPRIARDDLPVLNGQVISTFRVVFALLATDLNAPTGKTAEYQCNLLVYTSKGWSQFSEDDPTSPVYLKPVPRTIVGTFIW